MHPMEWIGFIAGAITTFSYVPQVYRVYQLKSAWEISLTFNIAFIVGLAGWLVYGVYTGQPPLVVWNAVSLTLALAILNAKLKYRHGEHPGRARGGDGVPGSSR